MNHSATAAFDMKLETFLQNAQHAALAELSEWLRIPSVSTLSHTKEM